ncbi:hypothetical protein BD626DRAFT_510058 [Schizophyllum amplum]|uniref:Uncharacterized protein n=1 Tax=Schizophyllum amplum TaxID=97359 RepID=A0A550C285_9AGAR|nr:hypothetical protein BD626DRAFT_510058 [Auriculariopsis ampla]
MVLLPLLSPHIILAIGDPKEYRRTAQKLWELYDLLPPPMRPALNPGTGYPRGNAFEGGWCYLFDRSLRYIRYVKSEINTLEAAMGLAERQPRNMWQETIPSVIVAPSTEMYLREQSFLRMLWKELPEGYSPGTDHKIQWQILREVIRFIRDLHATLELWKHGLGTSDIANTLALLGAPQMPTEPPIIQTHAEGEPDRRLDDWILQSKIRWELQKEARADAASALAIAADADADEQGLTDEERDAWRRMRAEALEAGDLRAIMDDFDPALDDGADDADDLLDGMSEEEAALSMQFYESGYNLDVLGEGEYGYGGEDSDDEDDRCSEADTACDSSDTAYDSDYEISGVGAGSFSAAHYAAVKRASFSTCVPDTPTRFDMSLDRAIDVVEQQMAISA